jgi:hypothetical protein
MDTDGKCYQVDEESQEWALDGNGQRLEIDTTAAMERYGFADFNPCGRTFAEEHGGYQHDPETAADAAAWIQHRAPTIAQSQPWFIAVNLVNPHDVMYFDSDGPDGQTQVTDLSPILAAPVDPLYARDWQPDLPRSFVEDDLSTKPAAQRNMADIFNFGFGDMPADRPDLWQARANYYINCVRDVDRHIGTLLDALEASGQADQTIIIFKSDHGEMGGAHGLGHKGPLIYDDNNNVPLIIVHPEYPQSAGRTTATLASAADFAPTVLSLAGLSEADRRATYPSLVGYDLSGALQQPDQPGERRRRAEGVLMTWDGLSIFDPDVYRKIDEIRTKRAAGERVKISDYTPLIDLSKRGFMRGIFDGRYKFARYFSPLDYHVPEDLETLLALNDLELYDTEADPDELNNLAHPDNPAYNPQLIETMNGKLNKLIMAEIGSDEGQNLPIPRLELYS